MIRFPLAEFCGPPSFHVSRDGVIHNISLSWRGGAGFPEGNLEGKSLHILAHEHPLCAPLLRQVAKAATVVFETGKPYNCIAENQDDDPAKQYSHLLQATPVQGPNGEVTKVCFLVLVSDPFVNLSISDNPYYGFDSRKRAPSMLAPVRFFEWSKDPRRQIRKVWDDHGDIYEWHPVEQGLIDVYLDTEPVYHEDFIHPDDRARVAEAVTKFAKSHHSLLVLRYRVCRADGSSFEVEEHTTPKWSKYNKVVGLKGRLHYLTPLRRAQRQRDDYKQLLERFLQASSHGWWDYDLIGRSIHYSARWFGMLGLDPVTREGDLDVFLSRVHPNEQHRVQKMLETAIASSAENVEAEFPMLHGNGRYIRVRWRCFITRDQSGTATRVLATHQVLNQ